MKIDRLPVSKKPGFDCMADHANCPVCRAHGENNHGRFGGSVLFAVATTHPQIGRVALVLEVLAISYPEVTPRPLPAILRKPRGATVSVHIPARDDDPEASHECEWIDGARCSPIVVGYGVATKLYADHGVETTDEAVDLAVQGEEFWATLEVMLSAYLADESNAGGN